MYRLCRSIRGTLPAQRQGATPGCYGRTNTRLNHAGKSRSFCSDPSEVQKTPWISHQFIRTMAGSMLVLYAIAETIRESTASKIVSEEHSQLTEPPTKAISYDEVQKHNSAEDCWVVINGMVYDLSTFLETHPGGAQAILGAAGKDSTELFAMIHSPYVLDMLPAEACLGPVDPLTLPEPAGGKLSEEDIAKKTARDMMPDASDLFLLDDFEYWAGRVLSNTAWSYYRSAADEERSFHENRDAFQRYFFRPRILRGTSEGSLETSITGIPSMMPLFISPTAMAKLGHPLGELNLTKAAGKHGVVQMISSNASYGLEEIFDVRNDNQPLMFQLYLNKNRSASAALLKKVESLGAKAIVFTVDVAWDSKRTLDVRAKVDTSSPRSTAPSKKKRGVAQAIGSYQDRDLTWGDISFIRQHTKLPIIIKGVQCLADVQLCVDHRVEGVILSNHGGRQADYAPASIDILYEIRTLRPDLFEKIDIMIDGGIRCGADVVKALAMGAKAVGIGRPFLYANSTHGEEGVSRVMEILQEEITNTMRNIGVKKVEELQPEMVGPAGPWLGQCCSAGTKRPSFQTTECPPNL